MKFFILSLLLLCACGRFSHSEQENTQPQEEIKLEDTDYDDFDSFLYRDFDDAPDYFYEYENDII